MHESPVPHWSRRVLRRRHLAAVGAGVLLLSGALVLWTSHSSNTSPRATLAGETSDASHGSPNPSARPTSSPSIPAPAPIAAADGTAKSEPASVPAPATTEVAATVAPVDSLAKDLPADAELAQRLVGTWEQYRHGRRVLTVREDGTAAMDVNVDGAWSFVFGKKLKFDIAWRVEQGVLKFELTDGEPKWGLDVFVKTYGRSRMQPILELSDLRLVLQDEDKDKGEPNHDWKRLP